MNGHSTELCNASWNLGMLQSTKRHLLGIYMYEIGLCILEIRSCDCCPDSLGNYCNYCMRLWKKLKWIEVKQNTTNTHTYVYGRFLALRSKHFTILAGHKRIGTLLV